MIPICAYCDCTVPSQRHKLVKHKKEFIALCADGGVSSCYNKWKRLKIAQRASLDILHIVEDCKLNVCKKGIKKIFRIDKMREVAVRLLNGLLASVKKISRKSTMAIKKLLRRLKTLADIVGLENQYQQIKTVLM